MCLDPVHTIFYPSVSVKLAELNSILKKITIPSEVFFSTNNSGNYKYLLTEINDSIHQQIFL